MSKIRITLVALGVAAAVASVPALAVTGAADDERYTVAKEITIKPGHDTGWETRLGRTVVIVKHGTLTVARGTDPSHAEDVYPAGEAFLDSGQYGVDCRAQRRHHPARARRRPRRRRPGGRLTRRSSHPPINHSTTLGRRAHRRPSRKGSS